MRCSSPARRLAGRRRRRPAIEQAIGKPGRDQQPRDGLGMPAASAATRQSRPELGRLMTLQLARSLIMHARRHARPIDDIRAAAARIAGPCAGDADVQSRQL